jgi:hypothetical protein
MSDEIDTLDTLLADRAPWMAGRLFLIAVALSVLVAAVEISPLWLIAGVCVAGAIEILVILRGMLFESARSNSPAPAGSPAP